VPRTRAFPFNDEKGDIVWSSFPQADLLKEYCVNKFRRTVRGWLSIERANWASFCFCTRTAHVDEPFGIKDQCAPGWSVDVTTG